MENSSNIAFLGGKSDPDALLQAMHGTLTEFVLIGTDYDGAEILVITDDEALERFAWLLDRAKRRLHECEDEALYSVDNSED